MNAYSEQRTNKGEVRKIGLFLLAIVLSKKAAERGFLLGAAGVAILPAMVGNIGGAFKDTGAISRVWGRCIRGTAADSGGPFRLHDGEQGRAWPCVMLCRNRFFHVVRFMAVFPVSRVVVSCASTNDGPVGRGLS